FRSYFITPSPSPASLPHGFKRQHGGGYAHVERVDAAAHGDDNGFVAGCAGGGREAVGLGAHYQGGGRAEVAAHVAAGRGREGRRVAANALFAQESQDVGHGRGNGGHREHAADAGADGVGVVEVGARVADEHGVDRGRVGSAEDGAQVAGLFHGFEHDE